MEHKFPGVSGSIHWASPPAGTAQPPAGAGAAAASPRRGLLSRRLALSLAATASSTPVDSDGGKQPLKLGLLILPEFSCRMVALPYPQIREARVPRAREGKPLGATHRAAVLQDSRGGALEHAVLNSRPRTSCRSSLAQYCRCSKRCCLHGTSFR